MHFWAWPPFAVLTLALLAYLIYFQRRLIRVLDAGGLPAETRRAIYEAIEEQLSMIDNGGTRLVALHALERPRHMQREEQQH